MGGLATAFKKLGKVFELLANPVKLGFLCFRQFLRMYVRHVLPRYATFCNVLPRYATLRHITPRTPAHKKMTQTNGPA